MYFSFFNVESIRGFTSSFVAIYSDTPYPFEFPYRSKRPPLDILKFLVTQLSNQGKKIVFIRVDEDGSMEGSYEFMIIFHNVIIIVQTVGGYAYSINGKSEISNKTLDNITRAIILYSSRKKELCRFVYH